MMKPKTLASFTVLALSAVGGFFAMPTTSRASCGIDDPCTSTIAWTKKCCKQGGIRCQVYRRRPCDNAAGFDYDLLGGDAALCSSLSVVGINDALTCVKDADPGEPGG